MYKFNNTKLMAFSALHVTTHGNITFDVRFSVLFLVVQIPVCGRFKTWFDGHVAKPMRKLATPPQCAYLKKEETGEFPFVPAVPPHQGW